VCQAGNPAGAALCRAISPASAGIKSRAALRGKREIAMQAIIFNSQYFLLAYSDTSPAIQIAPGLFFRDQLSFFGIIGPEMMRRVAQHRAHMMYGHEFAAERLDADLVPAGHYAHISLIPAWRVSYDGAEYLIDVSDIHSFRHLSHDDIDGDSYAITRGEDKFFIVDCQKGDYQYITNIYTLQDTDIIRLDTVSDTVTPISDTPCYCSVCDTWHALSDVQEYIDSDGCRSWICNACYNDGAYTTCYHCDTVVHMDNTQYSSDTEHYYCSDCADTQLYRCTECGDYFANEDNMHSYGEETYCHDCYDDLEIEEDDENSCSDFIHDYSYKPTPKFFFAENEICSEKENLCFGLELEIEYIRSYAEATADFLGRNAYLKDDSSVNDGFEIVFHPRSLESWREYIGSDLYHLLRDLEREGAETDGVGLHVHTGRADMTDAHKSRYSAMVYLPVTHTKKIARRTSTYAALRSVPQNTDTATDISSGDYRKISMPKKQKDRYEAVNWTNCGTVELRIWKSTTKPDLLMAAIEYAHSVYHYTKKAMPNDVYTEKCFENFAEYLADNAIKYPNLIVQIQEYIQDMLDRTAFSQKNASMAKRILSRFNRFCRRNRKNIIKNIKNDMYFVEDAIEKSENTATKAERNVA
jgi:hypothetical protein